MSKSFLFFALQFLIDGFTHKSTGRKPKGKKSIQNKADNNVIFIINGIPEAHLARVGSFFLVI